MTFLQDFRIGFRTLLRSPRFSVMAVAALALGIGANTAIWSVVSGVLLRSLPYAKDDEIVMLWSDSTAAGGSDRLRVTPGDFADWRRADTGLTGLAALVNDSLRLTSLDEPVVPLTQRVTANFFDVLGVEAHLGRTFLAGEDLPGRGRIVVLSYGLWQRALGGDPEAVGDTLELDDEPYAVVGILPPEFVSIHQFGVQPDVFVPLALAGREDDRRRRELIVYGRRRPNYELSTVSSAMTTVAERLAREHPETNEGFGVRVVPIRDEAVGRVRPMLVLLLSAVGLVLLIACANVAGLMLARATERGREIALRRTLGAGRVRILQQLICEGLTVSLVGSASGLLIAAWALKPLLEAVPAAAAVPFLAEVTIDLRVLAVTFLVSTLSGTAFGLVPARQAGRLDLNDALKLSGRSASASRSARRAGDIVVVAEIALALALVVSAGLALQSFRNLRSFEPGFDVERLLKVRNAVRGSAFETGRARTGHFEAVAERLSRLPGAVTASAVSFEPPTFPYRDSVFTVESTPVDPGFEPTAVSRVVLPRYFPTMGIPLSSGRLIDATDRDDSLPVAVVNEALAAEYFPGRDPVGESIVIRDAADSPVVGEGRPRVVVGVVGNVRSAGADPSPLPVVYLPHAQAPVAVMSFVLRVEGDPARLARAAEKVVWDAGGDINVYAVETLASATADLDWRSRVSTSLLGLFALLALALGAAGVYAVIAFTVSSRTHEIGLRMAMGARRSTVVGMILRRGLALASAGILTGVGLTLLLGRFLAGLLYGVAPADAATLLGSSLVLTLAAVAAALAPALRASRIDPMEALRAD